MVHKPLSPPELTNKAQNPANKTFAGFVLSQITTKRVLDLSFKRPIYHSEQSRRTKHPNLSSERSEGVAKNPDGD